MKTANNSRGKSGAKISKNISLTPALLRLDPMIDPRRSNPRFKSPARKAATDRPQFFAELKQRNVYKVVYRLRCGGLVADAGC